LFQLLFCGELNTYRTMGSHGKSGSVFYYTYDSKFMIKTIKETEAYTLISSLPHYYKYITQNKTFIVPVLGLYTLEDVNQTETLYICVMKNLFASSYVIDEIFDLKGSTLDRTTPTEARKPGVPLKDLDFGSRVIPLLKETTTPVMSQLQKDTIFLCNKMQTMDYSLLLGIHKVDPNTQTQYIQEKRTETSDRGFFSYNWETIYYFGIIDYLIRYDVTKQVESVIKRTVLAKKEEISSVAPQDYASRFVNYLDKKIWSP